MNKKVIILVSIFVALIIGGVWGTLFYLSQHVVSIRLTDQNTPVELIQDPNTSKNKLVTKFSKNENIRLSGGNYCIYPTDSSNYDTSNGTCFTVKDKDISVTVTPDYSASKLQAMLTNDLSAVQSVIKTKYAPIINNYRLANGTLYMRGQWYGTTLTEVTAPNERGDVYRVILEQVNGQWQIAARPALALNKYDYPNIPHQVLDAVNKQDGTY